MTDQTEPPDRPSDAVDLKSRIEAERTGRAFVYWKDGDQRQQIRVLDPAIDRLTIGRGRDQDIVIDWDKQVSRSHALVEKLGGEWFVDDLSRNGSYVNGDRVGKRLRLRHKDVMCFGATRIAFEDRASAEESDSTARASDEVWAPMTATQRRVLLALCRPLVDNGTALPAANRQIADEVGLGVDAVKAHLRVVYDRYGLSELAQMEKRTRLARLLLANGTFHPHDF
jgi:hypothetical protein